MKKLLSELWKSEKNLRRLKPEFKSTNTRISQYGLFLGIGIIGPMIFMISGIVGLGELPPEGVIGDILFFAYLIFSMIFMLYAGVFTTSFIYSLYQVSKGRFTKNEAKLLTLYFRAPEWWLEKDEDQ